MQPVVGAYGKIPSRGDFVRRRLPNSFIEPWDEWLQQAISHSREDLGESWLELYLSAPIWRFVLASPLAGDATAGGVMLPSIDAVHRHFPLTLSALLSPRVNPFALVLAEEWFTALEELGLACLDAGFSPEKLDAPLEALAPPTLEAQPPWRREPAAAGEEGGWSLAPDRAEYETRLYPALLDHWLRRMGNPYSLWWTSGSDAVQPTFRIFRGLPAPEAFCSFLTDEAPAQPAAKAALFDEEESGEAGVGEDPQ